MTTTENFLRSLYGNFEDGWLTLFSIDTTTGERHTDYYPVDELEQMAAHAVTLDDRHVWFGVATRNDKLPDGRRGGSNDCAAIPALWGDFDIAGPNHKDSTGLPTSEAEALELIGRFPLKPSTIIHSGGGIQAYWLTSEAIERPDAVALLERWGETWEQIATKYHMRVDNVFDIARVMRMPGTTNHKNGAPCRIVSAVELRYGYSEFVDATVDPPPRVTKSLLTGTPVVGTRPGDVFNQRHGADYVLSLAGWTRSRDDHDGNQRWLHPWQPSSDCSATVYADDGHVTIWSDTVAAKVPSIAVRTPYDAFGLYVRLEHDGDFNAATRKLLDDGYGERVDVTLVTMPNGKCRPKRKVITSGRSLDALANDVTESLLELNDPPNLFVHGDIVSKFDRGELAPIDRVALTHIVESSLSPTKRNKDGDESPSRIDPATLDLVLYRMLVRLPRVEGVARSPFLRADGTICADPGWDADSGMYLASTLDVDTPEHPTQNDVLNAVALLDEFIVDFPVDTPADRAHIFALLLTMSTRHLVPLAPLFALDGNGPGVGKNLLAECITYIATGEWIQTDPLPLDAEEQRKQITAMLSTGRSIALFDEAHIITGTSLARLITSTTWGDRLLGYSKQVSYPNNVTVVALGNNVEVQGDMPRRTILIRLSSNLARPELRTGFHHDDLRSWVADNRHRLLSAVLTILRSWAVNGQTPGTNRLGSFDAWSQLVGGALDAAGVEGFLSNADEMRSRGASDDLEIEDHLAELHEWYGDESFTSNDVIERMLSKQFETCPPKVSPNDTRAAAQLGYAYRRIVDRRFGDLMLETAGRSRRKSKRWQVVDIHRATAQSQSGSTESEKSAGSRGTVGNCTSYTQEKVEEIEQSPENGFEDSPSSPTSPHSPHPRPLPDPDEIF